MNRFLTQEVFTPASAAHLTYIERDTVTKQLNRALHTTGKQIIIYGHSGSGKTTILQNKLSSHYDKVITTNCESRMKIESVILDAFNQLNEFIEKEKENSDLSKASAEVSAGLTFFKAKGGVELSEEGKVIKGRILELQLTPQTLAEYLGKLGYCWVIEDFHKIRQDEKKNFSEILKIFMDRANKYKKLKIIAIGAVNTAREVIQYEPEMKNRISEIFIPLMSQMELTSIITTGERLLNVSFGGDIRDKIVMYSHGLPSITHELCSIMCLNREVIETAEAKIRFNHPDLEEAIEDYIKEYSDSFKSIYDTATYDRYKRKYDKPKKILEAVLNTRKEEASISEIAEQMRKKNKNYKPSNLKKYLEELTTSGRMEILRLNKDNLTFSFSTPFIKAYANFKIHKENGTRGTTKRELTTELKIFMLDYFEEFMTLPNDDLDINSSTDIFNDL